MKKGLVFTVLLLSSATIISAIGTGFYIPDKTDYINREGTSYSDSENNAASSIYPIGTILEITNQEGNSESVYVNDRIEMPPDRRIMLNRHAASQLAVMESGYEDLSVEVVFIPEKLEDEGNQGWYKFLVSIVDTNEEANNLYSILQSNGLKPSVSIENGRIDVFVRYIPQYQTKGVDTLLENLGYPDAVMMDDENPYI